MEKEKNEQSAINGNGGNKTRRIMIFALIVFVVAASFIGIAFLTRRPVLAPPARPAMGSIVGRIACIMRSDKPLMHMALHAWAAVRCGYSHAARYMLCWACTQQ